MKQKASSPISLRGIPGNDISQTITWYDAENDRLFFDSYSSTTSSSGSDFSPCGHNLHAANHGLKPRPFPSPGTSPCTETHSIVVKKNNLVSSSLNDSSFSSCSSTISSSSSVSMAYTPNHSQQQSISAMSSPSFSSTSKSGSPVVPIAPPAPPLPTAYPLRSIPSNVKVAQATIASNMRPSKFPIQATIVPATPVNGTNLQMSGWNQQSSKRSFVNLRRNSGSSRQHLSYRHRSGSAPTINYASVAMATVLDYPPAMNVPEQQKVYTATAIESPVDTMDVDTVEDQDMDEPSMFPY